LNNEHNTIGKFKKILMHFGIQPIHIIIIIVVTFLLFGGSKLPEMGQGNQ
jgi:hypothetical protein